MKVLIIGGTGIISSDVALLAAQRDDIELYVLNRGRSPSFLPAEVKSIHGDVHNVGDMRNKLSGMNFDVVCDFISYDVSALQTKLELFRNRCAQYVFISSVAAYKSAESFYIKTEANSTPGSLTWSYGYNKFLCEQMLAESSMNYTIVRPSYTYNDIRFFNPYTINHWESWTIANRMLRGKPIVLQDNGMQLCTVTHTTDFAKAFVGLWGNPAAMNEGFHITSNEYLTWRQIAEMQAEILGAKIEFCLVDSDKLCYELGWNAAEKIRHTAGNECYDSAKVRAAVPEFKCTTPFQQGIARTIKFYLDNPQFQRINAEWDRNFDRICEKYR
jgi:nucleoside-diphosphate-sugar epimerase